MAQQDDFNSTLLLQPKHFQKPAQAVKYSNTPVRPTLIFAGIQGDIPKSTAEATPYSLGALTSIIFVLLKVWEPEVWESLQIKLQPLKKYCFMSQSGDLQVSTPIVKNNMKISLKPKS